MTVRTPSTKLIAAASVALLILLLLAIGVGTARAAGAPRWEIETWGLPTNFEPGDESGRDVIEAVATNVGSGATDGSPITITDTLPAGLIAQGTHLFLYVPQFGNIVDVGFFCATSTVGPRQEVRCEVPTEFAGMRMADVAPEGLLRLVVVVGTPSSATGALENAASVEGGGTAPGSAVSLNHASAAFAPSGVERFGARLVEPNADPVAQAGSYPDRYVTRFRLNSKKGIEFGSVPAEDVRDQNFRLPPGLIGNPTATPRCTPQQFTEPGEGSTAAHPYAACPDGTAVGLISVELERNSTTVLPVYNLIPPKGMPAQFGFKVGPVPIYIDTELRTGGDYGITAFVPNTIQLQRVIGAKLTLWGVPAAAAHDWLRGRCLGGIAFGVPYSLGVCPAGVPPRPFLRLPTSCSAPMQTEMSFDTWPNPAAWLGASSTAPAPTGCARLDFTPTITLRPEVTAADSPTGLHVDLHVPQNESPEGLAEADLKDAVVTLPAGVSLDPAAAGGLVGCPPSQVELDGAEPATCPDASKIGTVEVDTPLVDHPLEGAVYAAQQGNAGVAHGSNPFGSLLAIYIAVADPRTGVVVKLAGHVEADPATGRLTTTFSGNPQLPFEDFKLDFFGGPHAVLQTPPVCGGYTTTTRLTPWSAPEGADATPTDSFSVGGAPNGASCAATESQLPAKASFEAGAVSPLAGIYTPFVIKLSREDGTQRVKALNLTLPQGLTGRLAGTPYCPDSAIAQAAARDKAGEGALEQASPSCPGASQVGTVDVAAGAGSTPVHVQGKAYLAGPYKGAPLSVVVITPAVAGPFDLGTVVVRTPLQVNEETAQISARSDAFPSILEGIPLDIRSIAIDLSKPEFTYTPSSCEAMAVSGEAITTTGQVAPLANRFQVGGCKGLDFAPKLALKVFGKTNRNAKPRLRAVLRMQPGEAAISRAQVNLPHSLFLEQNHIKTVCTRVQWNEGGGHGERCPEGSIYGRARAITPLLEKPLEGPVYLRSNGGERKLPDLVAALNGQIDIALWGKVDSGKNQGLRNTFEVVPDAPVSKFTLEMKGGRKGLLVNSENLCSKTARKRRAIVRFTGHNGKVHQLKPRVANQCKKRQGKKQKSHKRSRGK